MGARDDETKPCDICDQWTADICEECGNCKECCLSASKCKKTDLEQYTDMINKQLEMEKEKELWDM